jgi:hypothetical protein
VSFPPGPGKIHLGWSRDCVRPRRFGTPPPHAALTRMAPWLDLAQMDDPCIFPRRSRRWCAYRQPAERGEMSRVSEPPFPRVPRRKKSRALAFGLSLVDPRAWFQLFRMVHYYNYSHVRPRRLADIGSGVRMAPNVSLANGERIKIGAYSHIGARCSIWAGDSVGRMTLGRHALLGPEVFIPHRTTRPSRERRSWISPKSSATCHRRRRLAWRAGYGGCRRRDRGRLHRRRQFGGHAVDPCGFDRGRKPSARDWPEGRSPGRGAGSRSGPRTGRLRSEVTLDSSDCALSQYPYHCGGVVNDGKGQGISCV